MVKKEWVQVSNMMRLNQKKNNNNNDKLKTTPPAANTTLNKQVTV